jgi:hypothetical protein
MNKGILIGIGILTGCVISAGTFAVIMNAKARKNHKQIAKETGIPYNEVKAAFKSFEKELKNMKKNKATDEQINEATIAFYEKLGRRAAA